MKAILTIALAVVLTVAGLAYALSDVDWGQLQQQLAKGRYDFALPAFLVLLSAHFLLKAQRWAGLLRPLGKYSYSDVLPSLMIGFAGNNLMPAHLGELVRTVIFSRQAGQPLTGVLVSQVLERILDIIAVLAWILVAFLLGGDIPEQIRASALIVGSIIGAVSFGIFAVLVWPNVVLAIWRRLSLWLPKPFKEKGTGLLNTVILALSSLKSPARLALLLLNSLGQWGMMLGMIWISLWTYDVEISLQAATLLLSVLVLAVTLPNSPGYIGAIQAAFVFALGFFSIDAEIAFAGSVFFLFAQWIPVTLIGSIFFFTMGLRFSTLQHDIQGENSRPSPLVNTENE